MTPSINTDPDPLGFRIAIVGATGLVGETLMKILDERDFPVAELIPLASTNSRGRSLSFKGETLQVQDLAAFDFEGIDMAFFSAGAAVSTHYAPIAANSGAVVIDNSSVFRTEMDIPLVIPEVNPNALAAFRERNIIANPNCSTIQMLVALKPIYDAVGIRRIEVATYQSVSGMGNEAIKALASQSARLMNGLQIEEDIFHRQMAFNVIPQIDTLQPNGYTREEMKMVWETQKILSDTRIEINPTCVRVPVFFGHSEAVCVQTDDYITVDEVRNLLKNIPALAVVDKTQPFDFATAATHAVGQDLTYVSRIREDLYNNNGINLWVVSDNIRKGAALNAVQIAELLVKCYL